MTNKAPTMGMGFLLGIGIGAAAGILLAPRKGEETRRQIQETAANARDKVKQHWSRQKEEISKGVDELASTAQAIATETKRGSKASEANP